MTRGKKILVGCLAVPLALILVLVLLVGAIFLFPGPEPHMVERAEARPLGPVESGGAIELEPAGRLARSGRVTLELEEGDFEILPGERGSELRVESEYDETAYSLDTEAVSEREVRVRFHRTLGLFSMLRRIRQDGGQANRVRVYLPRDVAIDLNVELRRSDSKMNLSGVGVSTLHLDNAMGAVDVRFDEPNPVPMESLTVRSRMGDLEVRGLGNAAVRVLDLEGRMGSQRLDFDGFLEQDVKARINVRMGDVVLVIPSDVEAHLSRRAVSMGELRARRPVDAPEHGAVPTVSLDVDVKMGEVVVR